MTVSVDFKAQGDLDNPKHRQLVDDLVKAMEGVLDAHKDEIGNYVLPLHPSENLTDYSFRPTFKVEPDGEFRPGGKSHVVQVGFGFHINE